jgi:hypothetical protein
MELLKSAVTVGKPIVVGSFGFAVQLTQVDLLVKIAVGLVTGYYVTVKALEVTLNLWDRRKTRKEAKSQDATPLI